MTDLDVRALAVQVFGDEHKADTWLRRPLAELNHASPLEVATDGGASLIRTILGKIAWGAAA